MVTQLQPDVRAYLHGAEVIKRYIRVEEVAREYGLSVEETEYIAKAAGSLYKLTRIHLVKKERFDEFMKHIYKVPGTNKQIIKKFARIGEASIIYSIGRHRFIELAILKRLKEEIVLLIIQKGVVKHILWLVCNSRR